MEVSGIETTIIVALAGALATVVGAVWRLVTNRTYVHIGELESLERLTEQVVELHKLRLADRDQNIQRQHQIILTNARQAETAANLASTLIHTQEEAGGE